MIATFEPAKQTLSKNEVEKFKADQIVYFACRAHEKKPIFLTLIIPPSRLKEKQDTVDFHHVSCLL